MFEKYISLCLLRFKLGYTTKIVPVKKKNTNQHNLWQATTCKQHTIIYELTKKEDNFLKFATTNKNSTFDLATSAQQIVRQKKNGPAQFRNTVAALFPKLN